MAARRRWTLVVAYLAGVELALLIAQYLLGLWTNLYGPAVFTHSTSLASLDFHFLTGDLLFLVGVVVLIFGGLSREGRLLVPAVVLVVAVFVAGQFGRAFLGTNDPIYSFGMGAMFLVALFSVFALIFFSWRAAPLVTPAEPAPAPAAPPA